MLESILKGLLFKWGWSGAKRKTAQKFADDLALSIQQAHLGKLPKGQYAGQWVYAKKLTREQLCIPLTPDMLRQMKECKIVHQHEVQCRGLGGKMEMLKSRGNASVLVSIRFDGEMPDGERVLVDIPDAHLFAEFSIHEIHGWTLNSLREIKL